jgi:hypothetical protein
MQGSRDRHHMYAPPSISVPRAQTSVADARQCGARRQDTDLSIARVSGLRTSDRKKQMRTWSTSFSERNELRFACARFRDSWRHQRADRRSSPIHRRLSDSSSQSLVPMNWYRAHYMANHQRSMHWRAHVGEWKLRRLREKEAVWARRLARVSARRSSRMNSAERRRIDGMGALRARAVAVGWTAQTAEGRRIDGKGAGMPASMTSLVFGRAGCDALYVQVRAGSPQPH